MKRSHDGKSICENKTFKTHPKESFDKKLPNFRMPREIGNFSIDKKRCFKADRSNMSYFITPLNPVNVSFDLADGYEQMVQKDEKVCKQEHLDSLLYWILLNQDKFQLQSQEIAESNNRDLHTDFVSWRGLLTKLICTVYENRDDWKIALTKFNGTIYMCEFETELRKENNASMTERQKEMAAWGMKFEQYLTADRPNSKPVTTEPVNCNEEYAVVVRTRLNSHSLVFGGEVDAFDDKKRHYVEFKTTREIDSQRQRQNFQRFKLIKWWAQSYLVGIPEIVCGYRDDDGVVHRLETFKTLDIPNQIQELRDPWKPNVSLTFLDELLNFIKANVKENDPRVVYLMSWQPRQNIQLQKLGNNAEYQFLPEWYINGDQEGYSDKVATEYQDQGDYSAKVATGITDNGYRAEVATENIANLATGKS